MSQLRPFHIAFPGDDLEAARLFYGGVLGCPEGRSSEQRIDFDLFGHQIVAHHRPSPVAPRQACIAMLWTVMMSHTAFRRRAYAPDGKPLAERVRVARVRFTIEPYTRFKGEPSEQSTMFFLDPAGNALEFKASPELEQLFAK